MSSQTEPCEATHHAYERAKERMGWNANALEKMMQRAFDEGLKHSDMKGRLNRYVTKLWYEHKHCNNMRIHGEVIYFFANNVLITLYRVPNQLLKNVKFCKKG